MGFQRIPTRLCTFREGEQVLESIYDFLLDFVQEHGFPPTLREIAAGCHISHSNASYHLNKLEARGCISRASGQARGITLLNYDSD